MKQICYKMKQYLKQMKKYLRYILHFNIKHTNKKRAQAKEHPHANSFF